MITADDKVQKDFLGRMHKANEKNYFFFFMAQKKNVEEVRFSVRDKGNKNGERRI